MEIELNGAKLRVYEDGKIERFFKTKSWCVVEGFIQSNGYYAIKINYKKYGKHRILGMAFLGLDITDSTTYIDHIDRNPLNNHLSNLRIVSPHQNTFNTNAKGYYWHSNKWRSHIMLNGKDIHLGLFDTEEEANRVYLEAKKIYHII